MKLKTFFIVFTTCVNCFLTDGFSQESFISGVIRDSSTHELLPGVYVRLNDSTGTSTDAGGRYKLPCEPGTHQVIFSFIGYLTMTRTVIIAPEKITVLNIDLVPSATNLGTVVVSAGKFEQKIEEVTVSMAVVKPSLVENTNATSMDEAIEQIPGVTIIDGQPNIRGGSGFSYGAGSRVLLLVDDLPMLTADANDPKWPFLPTENLSQIEVIKGASSSLYGSSALNGVINVRTAFPGAKPRTTALLYTGFYDTPKRSELKWWGNATQMTSGANFNHSQRFGRLDFVIGGSAFKDEGYRREETEGRYRLNANLRYRFKKLDGLSAGINMNIQEGKGGLFVIWQDDSSGAYLPLGGVDSATSISYYTTTRANVDPYLTYADNKGNTHKIRARYFGTNNRNDTQQESRSGLYYLGYLYQRKFNENFTWTLGADEIYSDVKSEDFYGDHQGNNIAFYTQADYKINRLVLSFGARWEHNRVDTVKSGFLPVFRTGLNYRIFKGTHFRMSYGQGIRYPSIAEKFIKTSVGGDIYVYPNDSLLPESGWSAEAGFNQVLVLGSWLGNFDIAGFWTEYQDMMEFTFGQFGNIFTDPFFGLGFKSLNIGNTQIKGIDVMLTGEGKLYGVPLSILAGYTYIDPRQLDYNEKVDTLKNSANYNVLKYRYRHMAKADVQALLFKHVAIGMSMRYYSFMESIDRIFEIRIPGVEHYRDHHHYGDWIFDARVGYEFLSRFKISFIVRNVFNHEYMGRPADMQPPRSFTLQASIKL